MLRQNQVRQQDVKPYIRTFTRNNPLDLNEWAKEEGSLFEPGTLIFLLEPAKRPPGMSSFARGQQPGGAGGGMADAAQDGYRVKDMCVVVDKVDGKCWVLAISPSAFELRFIDTLFREKTQKAFLEGLDFQYLACSPRPMLNAEQLRELRQLSTLYSKSGSRRTVAQDGSGPEEPARAMLSFLGADLSSVGKQMIELGLICNLIFSPEGVQENKAQSQVKSCFSPILATDKLKGSTPPPPPSSASVVQNQELLNEEVSLLSQAYLENEAREAADFVTYNPPEPGASAPSAGLWTSTPAAPAATAPGADEFRPLEPPPFDLGGFPSGGPPGDMGQPTMGLSPDIPSILTGEHPVIAIDQKLGDDSNGQNKVPALPAWYMTTHNVTEMNEVALKRAQEAPAAMPEGLDRLESELSHNALPVIDARFRHGAEPPMPETLIPGAQTQAEQEASGAWASPQHPADPATSSSTFIDAIFEGSGARGTLETNPEAASGKTDKPQAGDWQKLDSTTSGAGSPGFVSPGSTAMPPAKAAPEIPDPGNLFDRLGGAPAPQEEPPAAKSWADGERGHPTNLVDMLTADSAVFTTSDKGKLQDITPPPPPEPSLEIPPPAIVETPSVAAETADEQATSSGASEQSPEPWMNLAAHDVVQAETASSTETQALSESPQETPNASSWDAFNQPDPTAPAPTSPAEAALAAASGQEQFQELAAAMRGLMTSPDAIEASETAEAEVQAEAAPEPPAAVRPAGSDFLFSEADIDRVLDSIDKPVVSEKADDNRSMFDDNRDQTQDLDTALMQRFSSGPATLHTTPSSVADEEVTSSTSIPALPTMDTSLVSPAMAAHAQAMVEPEPEPVAEVQPAAAPEPEPPPPPLASTTPEPVAPESSSLSPIRPTRRRTAELRAGIVPPELPADALLEPTPAVDPKRAALEDIPAPTPPTETEAPVDTVAEAAPPAVEEEAPAAEVVEPAAEVVEPAAAAAEVAAPAAEAVKPKAEVSETAAEPTASAKPESADAKLEDDYLNTPLPPTSPASSTSLTASQENEVLADLSEGFEDSAESGVFLTDKEPTSKPTPYGQESKLTASGIQRAHQPAVEPKLVISESTRFMARLNQRLSEADKKLSSRCDQSRDRLLRELDALVEEAHKVERQNELSTGALTEQLITHLETVADEVRSRIDKTSKESCAELKELIDLAEKTLTKMHTELKKELESTESSFQADADGLAEGTRSELNQHAQERINDFNQKLEDITNALESVYKHHIDVLMTRFEKFQTRLNEEVDAIVSALDRNVGSMTVEIDGSWDRASEKLMASQTEFGNSVSYLVHSCRAELKQVHLESYARKVLPRLLENKDIFRSMLLDMKRNFEEQSDRLRKQQLSSLANSITTSRTELDNLTRECLSTIESVGKGQQFGLEELFNSTTTRLEEIITTVETRLKSAKQEITDNDEACMKTSEASRVEDEPAFSREKQQAIAALNECRTKADNALETHISSSCLNLEQLSEDMQEDLAKQRQDWTAQVRTSADENINKVKQAIQDAFQAIETAKEKYME
jgi:hypothetical protein